MNKYLRLVFDKEFRFHLLASKGFYNFMSDERFLSKAYRLAFGQDLNLNNPTLFNEKLQWLKLYDHNPIYPQLVDKYAFRRYISEKLGDEYLVPLVGGPWQSPEDIDFASLPEQFVLKCTHDSGSVIVCQSKHSFDIEKAKKQLAKRLKRNYYYGSREWPYKNVKPQILAEEYINSSDEAGLVDYKFMCFNGQVKLLLLYTQVIDNSGKTSDEYYRNVYDREFNLLPVRDTRPNTPRPIQAPENYSEMVRIAEQLSTGFPHIRIDMYNVAGKIFIGEFTLYHGSGIISYFDPPEWNEIIGSWIELPKP